MLKDILKTKLEKLDNLRKAGIDTYPEKSHKDINNGTALGSYESFLGKEITLAGRVRSFRPMGGSTFAHIEDESGKIQIFLNKKNLACDKYQLFVKNVEIGDFVEAKGKLFKTKHDEKTLAVTDWKMLSKNIRPIPTEYFGLKDTEMLLRKRYLDLMMNPQTREIFRKKNIFWQTVRNFLTQEGFLEVQNPVLEHIPGGAEAEPFITHHKTLNQDFYLRISLELALKRLLVGGYEKVFEIGRVFRNEGIDKGHLQEYDSMEFYAAYWDLEKGMQLSEKLFKTLVKAVLGNEVSKYEENNIDWSQPFAKVDYFTEFKKYTGLDLEADLSAEALRAKADELKIKYEKFYGLGRMIDTLYKKTVRLKLIQPCFLVGHPLAVSPLAKKDPNNLKKVLRFQIVAGGAELCNAFSELNDPIDQRERLLEQMILH